MMNIVMSGNSTVYTGMELAIYSTLTHNKGINWYIFTMDISIEDPDGRVIVYEGLVEWQREKLTKIVHYLDKTSRITFIDAAPYYAKYLENSVNNLSTFTPYAALRLIIDVALPYLNDVLYFDCDVAVTDNFYSMYEECKMNKTKQAYAVYEPHACNSEGEMVSGVMFFNLDTARKNNFFSRARHNYNVNLYVFPDQMAMRDSGTIDRLNETYGYMWDYRKNNHNPIILHFTCELSPKIYCTEPAHFFRVFPEFEYVQKGTRLLDVIHGTF